MMQQDLYSVIQNKFNCDITVDNIKYYSNYFG